MKKICILQNDIAFGGTDTFVINLSQGLIKDGYDVTVVLSAGEKCYSEERKQELEATGVKIIKTCALNDGLKAKLNHLKLLYKELKNGKYDVFQTNIDLFNGPNLFVAWLAGVPIRACHSHNSQQGKELQVGRTLSVRLYQSIMRWLCWTFSNRRGGCSEIAMDFLFNEKWKNDKHSKVVHNGIDFSNYQRTFDFEEKKTKLGLRKKYNICTVGRISFQKNPFFIVDVMNELFSIRDDCDFVWVGTGDMEEQVHDRIDTYGINDRMHLLGSRSDVPEILRSMDIFFLPSLFEGLAIVLIEAQAAGLPCVTATTTTPESNCGSLLYLPLEESASFWAEKLSDVLDGKIELKVDPIKLDEYSIDHMVKEMEDLFEK
ncbi:MAG: glycosyltransferase [Clostridia bacterium]|nr:glycosyltransferase [Clostridia bacterium]